MIIAIDFDGTIVEHKFPEIGKLRKDAKEVINQLYNEGHYIIIWTCRYEGFAVEQMELFLAANDIKYHCINQNHPELLFSPKPKIYADIYIDDRQVGGLPSWKEIYNIIQKTGGKANG